MRNADLLQIRVMRSADLLHQLPHAAQRKLILVVNNETANTEEEPKMNHKMQRLVTLTSSSFAQMLLFRQA